MNNSLNKFFMASLVALAVISCQALPEEAPISQELADDIVEVSNGGENARKGFGTEFGAFLIGSEEVIGGQTDVLDSPGAGAASFSLSPDGESLNYEIRVANTTDILFGHLHLAPAGENGPVIATLLGANDGLNNGIIASGVIRDEDINGRTLTQLLDDFKSGNVYVNVHTAVNQGGELRGQISLKQPGAERNFAVQLSGANEVPAVMTDASGLAKFQFDASNSNLGFQVNIDGIESNILFSHIHLAEAGANGGVVATLRGDEVMGPFSGVYAKGGLTPDMLSGQLLGGDLTILKEAFRTGYAYVNVHSAAFGSGELRGNF